MSLYHCPSNYYNLLTRFLLMNSEPSPQLFLDKLTGSNLLIAVTGFHFSSQFGAWVSSPPQMLLWMGLWPAYNRNFCSLCITASLTDGRANHRTLKEGICSWLFVDFTHVIPSHSFPQPLTSGLCSCNLPQLLALKWRPLSRPHDLHKFQHVPPVTPVFPFSSAKAHSRILPLCFCSL